MKICCVRVVCSLALTIAICEAPAGAASPPNFRVLLGSPGQTTLAHWPDSIICSFPAAPYVDTITGLPTGAGESKPYSLIVRLTLAPAMDGLYYYGVGPILDIIPVGDPKPSHDHGLKPGAVLAFRPDGTPSSTGQGECAGKSIEQLTAAGLTGR